MSIDPTLLEALTASLASQVGGYLDSINATAPRPLSQFNASEKNSVYVIYTASGFPLSIGSISVGPKKRGRQGPPDDVARIRSNVPNAIYCSIVVGNAELANNLVRLMRQLFGHTLMLNTGSAPRTSGVATKRRGRPPGSGAKRRGRPAKVAATTGGKRGPGRPRTNPIVDQAAAPKRRGRPKGSKNRKAAKASTTSTVVKRAPGRPRKNPLDQVAAPKRRGRKPGSKNKPKVA